MHDRFSIHLSTSSSPTSSLFFLIHEPFHFIDKPCWVENALIKLLMDKSISAAKRRKNMVCHENKLPCYIGGNFCNLFSDADPTQMLDVITRNISAILSLLLIYIFKLDVEGKRKTAKKWIFAECLIGAGCFNCLSWFPPSQRPHKEVNLQMKDAKLREGK